MLFFSDRQKTFTKLICKVLKREVGSVYELKVVLNLPKWQRKERRLKKQPRSHEKRECNSLVEDFSLKTKTARKWGFCLIGAKMTLPEFNNQLQHLY